MPSIVLDDAEGKVDSTWSLQELGLLDTVRFLISRRGERTWASQKDRESGTLAINFLDKSLCHRRRILMIFERYVGEREKRKGKEWGERQVTYS